MSLHLLLSCCCGTGTQWRRAFDCATDEALNYYKRVADVNVNSVYGIDDGADRRCVYFSGLFATNPGVEATGLTEYDDCHDCEVEEMLPVGEGEECLCPDPDLFPGTLVVTGTETHYTGSGSVVCTCAFEYVLTKTGPCTWSNGGTGGFPPACNCDGTDNDLLVTLEIESCEWLLTLGAYSGTKGFGGPRGNYPNQNVPFSSGIVPYGYSGMQVV